MDRKNVTVSSKPFVLSFGVVRVVQNLNFDSTSEGDTDGRDTVSPKKQACISSCFHVSPLKLHDTVFVHPLRSHHTGRLAGRDNHAIFGSECFGGDIDRHPTRKIFAIEQGHPRHLVLRRLGLDGLCQRKEKEGCKNKGTNTGRIRFHRTTPGGLQGIRRAAG